MTFSEKSVVLNNVNKAFHRAPIFKQLTHSFDYGRYAITGPNGCGKTTLLSLIAGVSVPDKGNITIDGVCLRKKPLLIKKYLSFVPDNPQIYPFITVSEFISLIASIKKIKNLTRINKLLKDFNLQDSLSIKFDELSLGMQKKLMIVAAFLQTPRILLLDEPTNSLDSAGRNMLMDYLNTEKEINWIFCSSHDEEFIRLLEMEQIIINNGKLYKTML